MGVAWSSFKSKTEETAKAKRLQKANRYYIPDYQCILGRLPKKDNNLALGENVNFEEKELDTSQAWKLPHKNLRPLKDDQSVEHNDTVTNETSGSDLKTKLEAWHFYQFKTQHPLDKWSVSSLPNLYFTDM